MNVHLVRAAPMFVTVEGHLDLWIMKGHLQLQMKYMRNYFKFRRGRERHGLVILSLWGIPYSSFVHLRV